MELQQVRYFLAVYETRNFTRAAERCAVSQPALTAAIRKLEEEFEAPLFHRERTGAKLTALGQALLPRFERLAQETRAISDIAKNNILLKGVPIRIGVMNTIGPARIAKYFEAFRRKAGAIDVEIVLRPLSVLTKQLEEAELELAIGSPPQQLPPWLVLRKLYSERYVVALPPQHPLANQKTVSLKALDGQPYVDRLACELREKVGVACREAHVELYASYRTQDESWIESLVRAGVGFAFLPEFSVLSPESVSRPLVDPELGRDVCLLRSADHVSSPAARLLWDTLVEAAVG